MPDFAQAVAERSHFNASLNMRAPRSACDSPPRFRLKGESEAVLGDF